ncbi:hypothetical protein SPRG_06250 [Saprolegnia parasitica CBS 223.65]|uniref:UV excision repair protein RAD23 n=1 Tax=Saprolegnia parasitica (strain CBS 223.65) TaxID=695850 RepID=A0A067CNX1_SAPPC|nr:hypothetical protein SPRG_06250 [Saprolegnia parasitica CBS 223.65]KDO28201.1 hypothetical protein SPRG_06250 [Saprolegnia parasitica CBS 223.65]|eukprot:XP_012201026.1 hypothetical protein SPRG_06250 [Saprolegnia parasitica CBS 223.65]
MEVAVIVLGRLPPTAMTKPTPSKKRALKQTHDVDVHERFALRVALGDSVLQLKEAIAIELAKALQVDVGFPPDVQMLTAAGRMLSDGDSIGAALLDARVVVCALDFPTPPPIARATSPMALNDRGIAQLVAMGFPVAKAKHALRLSHNSVETAIAYLTEHILPPTLEDDTATRLASVAMHQPYLLQQAIQGCSLDALATLSLDMMQDAIDKTLAVGNNDAVVLTDESDVEESKDASTDDGEAVAIRTTSFDSSDAKEAVLLRLQSLGFGRDDALAAYMACDENESAAANCLLDSFA